MKQKERMIKICQLLFQNPGLRCPKIAQRLNYSGSTIERDLRFLKESNQVEYRGYPRTGGYYLIINTDNLNSTEASDHRLVEQYEKRIKAIKERLSSSDLPHDKYRKIDESFFHNIKKIIADMSAATNFYNGMNAYLDGDEEAFNDALKKLDNMPIELDFPILDAMRCESELRYLIEDYRNRERDVSAILDLYRRCFLYLLQNPKEYSKFIHALKKNFSGNSDELLIMFNELNEIAYIDSFEVSEYIKSSIWALKGIQGRNIDYEQRTKIFREIKSCLDKAPPESKQVFFYEYWEKNREECQKHGWKKPESLQAKFHQWETGKSTHRPFPLAVKYPDWINFATWMNPPLSK